MVRFLTARPSNNQTLATSGRIPQNPVKTSKLIFHQTSHIQHVKPMNPKWSCSCPLFTRGFEGGPVAGQPGVFAVLDGGILVEERVFGQPHLWRGQNGYGSELSHQELGRGFQSFPFTDRVPLWGYPILLTHVCLSCLWASWWSEPTLARKVRFMKSKSGLGVEKPTIPRTTSLWPNYYGEPKLRTKGLGLRRF